MQSDGQFVGHCDTQQTCGGPGSPIKQCFIKPSLVGLSKLVLNPGSIHCKNLYSCTEIYGKWNSKDKTNILLTRDHG